MASVDLQKFLDEIRARVSIVDVVGAKVKLVRKGREFQACCPFHNEKTPSFTVNEAKGFYHCFGCGAHGDIVKFEMEANNLPFMEAVEKLANKAGLPMPKFSKEQHEESEKKASLYDIMELAAQFFEKNLQLPSGAAARDYLARRGFGEDIVSKFRLGYAPANNGLHALLRSKNVAEKDMGELGLVSLAENNTSKRTFDFFRDRVMIPIFDKRGRVIGFGGRVMNDGQPKYLNSPETPLFNKRRMLYNYHYARDDADSKKNLLLCEGYMDVIALDKYGFHNAVAPLGTALTEEQIQEAWKICSEPLCCFDGDNAGIKAAMRAADRVLPILKPGNSLRFLFLPDRQDPDEFLKAKGRDAFEAFMQETQPLKDILWRKNIEGRDISTPEQKALIEKNVKEEVARIADETVKGYYVQEMQDKIYNELGRGARRQNHSNYASKHLPPAEKKAVARPKTNLDDLCARFVVSALVCYPELIEDYEEKLLNVEIENPKVKALLQALLDKAQEGETLTFETAIDYFSKIGLGKDCETLLEFKLMKQQNPDILKMRENLDLRIVESQIRQLEAEIRESLRILEGSDSFSDEEYKKYQFLKNELQQLYVMQNIE